MKKIKPFPLFVTGGLLADPAAIKGRAPQTRVDTHDENQLAKAWMLGCHVDIDAAVMIAQAHSDGDVTTEQTVLAMLYMASVSDYMNTYAQPSS